MRLSALFAMAIVATSAVTLKDETELDSQLTTQEDMQVQEASTAEVSATAMEALEDGEESTAASTHGQSTVQKIIGAAQNGCGNWCTMMGGPLTAINRRSSANWKDKSCTHSSTAMAGNWQSFDIPETREITDIKVLNRADCCTDRILQASVFAGWKVCGTFTQKDQLKGWAHFKCPK